MSDGIENIFLNIKDNRKNSTFVNIFDYFKRFKCSEFKNLVFDHSNSTLRLSMISEVPV